MTLFFNRFNIHTLQVGVLLLVGLVINIFLYFWFGIKIVNDTARYVEYSEAILANGIHFQEHNFWYLGFVLFISFFKYLGLSDGWIVLTQCLLSCIASLCIYRAALLLSAHKTQALIAGLLYLGWLKISQWNFYIHPESAYTSFCAIGLCSALWYLKKSSGLLLVLVCICIMFWIKPTGFVFGFSVLITAVAMTGKRLRLPWYALVIVFSALFLLCMPLLNQMLASFKIVDQMATGEIIYGYSITDNFPWRDLFIIDFDGPLSKSQGESPITEIFYFIIDHAAFFIKLAFIKLIAFIVHMKPYFSTPHNLMIAVVLFPSYWFCIRTIRNQNNAAVKVFIISYLILHCLIVMLTIEDWDGRFMLPLLPVIFLFASEGWLELFRLMKNRLPKST